MMATEIKISLRLVKFIHWNQITTSVPLLSTGKGVTRAILIYTLTLCTLETFGNEPCATVNCHCFSTQAWQMVVAELV